MSGSAGELYLKEQGEAVSRYLATLFSEEHPPSILFSAMNYSLLSGGKRLRPVLCLATARTLGVPEERVMPAAAALELLHCYSLIHDDLPALDDDDLRRGRPTNHRVYGEALALLAGDALLTYAFEQLSKPLEVPPERQLRMVHVLAHAAGCYGMVAGQVQDIRLEGQDGDLADLEFIHLNKTAKLIAASVEIGALFADVDQRTMNALKQFGLNIGLAFQIVDDLLDVVGSTEDLGKSVGADERKQKLTYPRLLGIEETRNRAQAAMTRALAALDEAGVSAPLLVGLAEYIVRRSR